MEKLGLVVLLASGCVTFDPIAPDDGDEPDQPTPPEGSNGSGASTEGRDAFKREVHPILAQQCGSCHQDNADGLGWFRTDPDEAYDTLTTTHAQLLGVPRFNIGAPLLTAPQRVGLGFYTADQIDRILHWFALELR